MSWPIARSLRADVKSLRTARDILLRPRGRVCVEVTNGGTRSSARQGQVGNAVSAIVWHQITATVRLLPELGAETR